MNKIQRYHVNPDVGNVVREVKDDNGLYVRVDDLVKYLHGEIMISNTNRKAFEEEIRELDRHSDEYKWQFIEAMKSEAELNAFILVLQALGKNPIKESK